MLSNLQVFAVLPAADINRAKEFYRDKLGLMPSQESEMDLTYEVGGGTSFYVYQTDNAGSAKNTQMCWDATDLAAEVADLRSRGVVFEDYDFPGLKTVDGIADMGNERSAWFIDSEGNTICVSQRV